MLVVRDSATRAAAGNTVRACPSRHVMSGLLLSHVGCACLHQHGHVPFTQQRQKRMRSATRAAASAMWEHALAEIMGKIC